MLTTIRFERGTPRCLITTLGQLATITHEEEIEFDSH